jgi:hypothetical protein
VHVKAAPKYIDEIDLRSGKKSYLLFHYAPSVITTLYNMTSIKFEPCDQV